MVLVSNTRNCSLYIRAVKIKYKNICFTCVASNSVGVANASLTIHLNESRLNTIIAYANRVFEVYFIFSVCIQLANQISLSLYNLSL